MLVRGQRNFLQTADFSVQAGRYAGARAEKLPADSRFLSPSLAVCCREGREIACRQQISQSKPGSILSRGQRNCLQTADFSVQAGRYAGARAEKLSTDSRFLSPSLAYTVMWAEKIQNIRYIIDNISVQAGRYAVARAEKLPADSRFLCLSRGYAGARAEKFSTDSIFLSLSRVICCREGRENYLREQISQSKPGVYCHVGRKFGTHAQ